MNRYLRRVKRKLELLGDPVVQELVEDLLAELNRGGSVSGLIALYSNMQHTSSTGPKYRQIDLEEAIENELKERTFLNRK